MSRTRTEIETALDSGRLMVRLKSGNLTRARRNGKTKTWITRPHEFRIPIKYSFKEYGTIDNYNLDTPELVIEVE